MSFKSLINSHLEVFNNLEKCEEQVNRAAELMINSLKNGGTIFIAGNGGSAADAQHFAAELTGRFVKERKGLSGIALTTDTSALTAIANDYGFEAVFARQLEGLGTKGDCLVGISTSGNSPNILKALEKAKELGITTIGLTGRDGGKMKDVCDECLIIPSQITANIQEAHIFLIHYFCGKIDEQLGMRNEE